MKEAGRLALARAIRRLLSLNSRPLPPLDGPLLILAPHADDESLGCGGLIAAHAARGADVHVVFLTDSASADWSGAADRRARAALRRAEALAALAALGVAPARATFLEAPDGHLGRLELEVHRRTVARLADVLGAVRPAAIFLPYLGEGSTEHDEAHWLAREAMQVAGSSAAVWEYAVWAWWNALRLRAQLLRGDSNFHLDATAWVGAKRRALACHASQLEPLPAVLTTIATEPVEFYFRRRHLPT